MEGATGTTERELEVSASFTFQREGRAGEAALQQWRKEILRNEKRDVDLMQSTLYEGIQEWARQHHSDERAAGKSSRVTIQGGQIVQGSQKNPPVRLLPVAGIPPYTFWTLAVRNFKPVHEGDKLGLVYGEGGEATLLPDTEEGETEGEDAGEGAPQHVFTEVEDHQVWATCQKHGAGSTVLRTLARLVLHATDEEDPSEEEEKLIAARYKWLLTAPPLRIREYITSWNFGKADLRQLGREVAPEPASSSRGAGARDVDTRMTDAGPALEWEPSDLKTGLSTFENIFCRRCYVHDCHLHGVKEKGDPCLDPLANQRPASTPPATGLEMMQPCSSTCYWSSRAPGWDRPEEGQDTGGAGGGVRPDGVTGSGQPSGEGGTNADAQGKATERSEEVYGKGGVSDKQGAGSSGDGQSNTGQGHERGERPEAAAPLSNEKVGRDAEGWSRFQVGLFEQGVRMYGSHGSACRVARLLQPARTCAEVAHRLKRLKPAAAVAEASAAAADPEAPEKKEQRKRAKHNNKVNVLHKLARKRNADKLRREGDLQGRLKLAAYTPCACTDGCDDGPDSQCPCARALTPCEKYCACPGNCHLKEGLGCKCTSKCTQRSCPCLAAGRECDPDLCHGCMVSCGDPSSPAAHVGEPNPHRAHAPDSRLDQCGNMRLQQRRHKKILLGPSEVAGWGAFICGGAQAGELLGEYTGELVTDQEAEQRGRVYDANNKSFLFQLNDQFILDACHKGDKLKFANHSPAPNCRPKVVSVLGDHRVAIHVERNMESGEEIFYDYNYTENQAPDWALTEADKKRREREMQPIRKATKKGTKK